MATARRRTHRRARRRACGLAAALLLWLLSTVAHASGADGIPINLEDPPRGDGPPPIAADTTDIQRVVSDTTLTLRLDGHDLRLPYFSNLLLGEPHPEVTRAVVVIHGTLRNAGTYFNNVKEASLLAGGADSTSLLIAPQFLTEADVVADTLASDILFWSYMGWRQGDASLLTTANPRPARISSFAVIDSILLRLADGYPNLQTIVVAGHSAGGQFANRYAAGNPLHESLSAAYGLTIRYAVSNPSSYLYFDDRRWVPGTSYVFDLPPAQQLADCPNYDLYKYGLGQPNEYMNCGSAELRTRYSTRRVVYLLGGIDNDPNSTYLEKNCEAILQGEHRLQRGLVYRQHLITSFGLPILNQHTFAVVPGVGHDARGIFISSCGVQTLFDYGACVPNLPNNTWLDATTETLRAVAGRSAAWGDVDGDDDADLFVAASDRSDQLFRNDAGSFVDVTPVSLEDDRFGMACLWGDIDRDGDPDLCTVNWRAGNRLFRNDAGSFTDQATAPLDSTADQIAARFGDYDRDGDLDLFVCRVADQPDLWLRNDGEAGLVDVTPAALFDTLSARDACWVDVDNDHDTDLYVVNRDGPNRLFLQGDGELTELTGSPINDPGPGWAACFGDYDNDGDLDAFVVNRGASCKLIRNDLTGWTDVTASPLNDAGLNQQALWLDYDNDRDLDLYLVKWATRNRLFRNNGNGTFTDIAEYPTHDGGTGTGAAAADYDGDGDLDLYLANDNGWNKLLKNQATGGRHWLEVRLRGVQSNRDGIGARVRLVAGGVAQIREIGVEDGSPGQSEPIAHFGLNTSTTVDTLVIIWPSGIVQTELPGFEADRRLTVTESTEPAAASTFEPLRFELAPAAPNPFTAQTRFVLTTARAGEVAVTIHDAAGRRVRTVRRGLAPAGRLDLVWDGRDDRGRELPAGLYFCRAEAEGGSRHTRVLRLE